MIDLELEILGEMKAKSFKEKKFLSNIKQIDKKHKYDAKLTRFYLSQSHRE